MNQGQFAGRLGRDAELRNTNSGDVLNFSVGVTVGFGDKKRTLWVSCAIWGERASKLEPYLTKGKPVSVAGDVDLRTYETKDGKHGAELLLNVQRLTLQSAKCDSEQSPRKDSPAPAGGGKDDFDDSIPF